MKKLLCAARNVCVAGLVGIFAAANAASASAAAVIIYQDSFTGTNGSAIANRSPDVVNLTGNTWQLQGNPSNWPGNAIQNNRASLNTDIGSSISTQTTGSYTKPTIFNISVTFNQNNLTADSLNQRAIGLGFYSQQVTGGSGFSGYRWFTGLAVNTSGVVRLITANDQGEPNNVTLFGTQTYTGVWDTAADHTLSYSVNTTTGAIFDVLLDNQSLTFTATPFTDANTNFAGFYASSSSGSRSGHFDDFVLTAIPEPSSAALLGFALLGGVGYFRRGKR